MSALPRATPSVASRLDIAPLGTLGGTRQYG
jgi:hypothetical protein